MKRCTWLIALITFLILLVVSHAHALLVHIPAYRQLHHSEPFYVTESIDKLGGAALCLVAVMGMRRTGMLTAARELGIAAPPLPGIPLGLAFSLPLWIGFAFTRRFIPSEALLPLLFLTVFSPFIEELEYRGFGVLQLMRGTGWPFVFSVWPSTVLFGLGHVEQGQGTTQIVGLFLLTGIGGAALAWLVYRWQSLWVAVALHISMNLCWELFSVARTALGGWFAFVLQMGTILVAVVVTLYRQNRGQKGIAEPASGTHPPAGGQ